MTLSEYMRQAREDLRRFEDEQRTAQMVTPNKDAYSLPESVWRRRLIDLLEEGDE